MPNPSPASTDPHPFVDQPLDRAAADGPSGASEDASTRLPEPAARSLGRSWRVWLGVLISAGFLFYAFRGQNLDEVWTSLRRADLRWLPLALALYFAGVGVRAVRWSVLLRPVVAAARPRAVFPIVVVGYTANNVLPLRTGELVRAYVLSRRYGVRKTAALATIAVERLCDGLTMLGFMLAATSVISFTAELRHLALVAFALFAAVVLGLVALTLGGDLRDRLLQLALGPLPTPLADRVERMAESFLSGLGVLRRKTDLALVAATSVLAWGFEASMYWTIARGFGGSLAEAMGGAAALLTTGVANLATLVPAAPGYVGTFEAGVLLAVHGALGVPRGPALSYAILVHAALWFPITLVGAVEWWRWHLSLSQARRLDTLNGAAETADDLPDNDERVAAPPSVTPAAGDATDGRRGRQRRRRGSAAGRAAGDAGGRVSLLQAIVLGLVQGLTEFIPISSSAHLIVVPWLLGWEEPGLAFDAALHLGTLTAVVAYFWRDLWGMALALPRALTRPRALLRDLDPGHGWDASAAEANANARLALLIAVGTLPALLAGIVGQGLIEAFYHDEGPSSAAIVAVALALMLLGALLWAAERSAAQQRRIGHLTWRDAVAIGLAQATALIPGVSRSGATITAGLFQGLNRADAARFSFLLGVPIIAAAGFKGVLDALGAGMDGTELRVFAVGVATSAVAGFAAIWWLLRYLQRASTGVFVLYRFGLGIVLLVLVAAGIR